MEEKTIFHPHNVLFKFIQFLNGSYEICIVPGSRWNALPPGTLTHLARTESQGLKPILEELAAANTAAIK